MIMYLKRIFVSAFILLNCWGCNFTDYSERLSGGYTYWNEGEGLNSIQAPPGKKGSLFFLKKYDDRGDYIFAWQADSVEIMSASRRSFKPNTYYPSDNFFIIKVKYNDLIGPLKKENFFIEIKKLGYEEVEWKPEVIQAK